MPNQKVSIIILDYNGLKFIQNCLNSVLKTNYPNFEVILVDNVSKIRNKLGWKPKHNFEGALQETVKWYLKNERWWRHIATEQVLHPTPWKLKW